MVAGYSKGWYDKKAEMRVTHTQTQTQTHTHTEEGDTRPSLLGLGFSAGWQKAEKGDASPAHVKPPISSGTGGPLAGKLHHLRTPIPRPYLQLSSL